MWAEIEGNTVKLYGTIWSGDGPYIVSSLKKLLASNSDITIHVHSPGGSVIDGNLIYNAIKRSKANVTFVVDGLAASMMSIIILSGKTIKMASNAFIMIHEPSGDNQGNAKSFETTAKVLRAMEGNFLNVLSAKMGLPKAEITTLMDGDNWYTAEEALEAKLIDEIIDPTIEDNPDMAAYQDLKMVATLFKAWEEPEPPAGNTTDTHTINNSNKYKPKMKLTAESLKFLGLTAESSESEINQAIAAKNQKITDLQAKVDAEQEAKVKDLIDNAVATGKIKGSEKDEFTKHAQANFDLTKQMIDRLPVKGSLSSKAESGNVDESDERKDWTFSDWTKKDTAGLLQIKANDPERYKSLVETSGQKYN